MRIFLTGTEVSLKMVINDIHETNFLHFTTFYYLNSLLRCMNVVTTIIKSRHSVRKFKPDPVDEMVVRDAIECAALAPTARNIQPWLFGVIRDKGILAKIAGLAENGKFIADCTVCFAVFGEKKRDILSRRLFVPPLKSDPSTPGTGSSILLGSW